MGEEGERGEGERERERGREGGRRGTERSIEVRSSLSLVERQRNFE